MAEEYERFPVETDPALLAEAAFNYLIETIPGWLPQPGNLEAWLIEANARIAAETADVAADVPSSIFRYFGRSLVDLPPVEANEASAGTTWTMVDVSGYTIPAGTVVALNTGVGRVDGVGFEVVEEVIVPSGSLTTAPGGVLVQALEPGVVGSGLTTATLVDALSYVQSIAVIGQTTGGTDEEDDEDYLNRLREELQLLTPRPILESDFATIARRVPGVFRAVAVDGYDPFGQTYNNEKTLSVAVVDESGLAVPASTKAEVDTLLQGMREVNFLVYVVNPTYTTVNVSVSFTTFSTFLSSVVEAAVVEAMSEYLSPKTWGTPPFGDPGPFSISWLNQQVLRYLEVSEQVNRVEGVNYITDLTTWVGANPPGRVNLTLPGVVPLPLPGTITATVVAS